VIELYQQALKEHNNNPVGLAKSIRATHTAEGYNASCGDEITFHLDISNDGNQIIDISFDCDCCAICKASASALCSLTEGQEVTFLMQQTQLLGQLLNQLEDPEPTNPKLEKALSFLVPIKKHISRINCALLPWQTALKACNSPNSPKEH